MNAPVYDISGASVGTVSLDAMLFGIKPNVAVMHQALVRQQANARFGNHDTKTRGEVSGGGRKPYKQKGTGRARQGSTRAPQWKGGGTVWGPHPRLYTQSMPRKMRRLAIKSALSAKAMQVRVLRGAEGIEARTKSMIALLDSLGEVKNTLMVVPERIEGLYRATNNISNVKVLHAGYLNIEDLLKYERILFTVEALEKISGIWGDEGYTAAITQGATDAPAGRTTTAPETTTAEGMTAPEVMTTTMVAAPPGTPAAAPETAGDMATDTIRLRRDAETDAEIEPPATETTRLRRADETEDEA